eukprot:gene12409-12198_t
MISIGTLIVADITGPSALDTEHMQYRLLYADARQARPYAYNQWAATPFQLLGQRLRTNFAQAGVKVLSTTDAITNPTVLRIEVNEFGQNFTSASSSHGVLNVRASLFRNHRLLDQRTFQRSVAAATPDAAGGAQALAEASDALAADLLTWLAGTSPFTRGALLVYVLLIVYASWFPFTGWHNQGLSPLIFLEHGEMPRYWTKFDAIINVVGYMPLGTLIVYALYPRLQGWAALLLASASGLLLSGLMEGVQTYLPSRVSSNLDFYTNSVGCMLGAVIGVLTVRRLLDQSELQRLRKSWFAPHASHGLVLLALWPLAQIYPQNFLFGLGQLLPILSEWLSQLLDTDIDLAQYLRPDSVLTVE